MAAELIHYVMQHLVLVHPAMTGQAIAHAATPAPGPPPGAPDFSKIAPNSDGVPKSGVMFVIAQVTLYFGLGLLFLVGCWELIKWGAGHQFGGMHVSQQAKANIARVVVCGVALTVVGGMWTWITALS